MASLWLTAAAANREAKARNEEAVARHREAKAKEIDNLLTNADHQRELWTDAYKRPELERVFQAKVDLAEKPITVAEKEFLNLVLVQYQITWCIAEAGDRVGTNQIGVTMVVLRIMRIIKRKMRKQFPSFEGWTLLKPCCKNIYLFTT